MSEPDHAITSNRSTLKEFLASIATIQGDLSNITAPPFVLGEASTVELPQYWADHPFLFLAPARGKTPEERILFVLRWFLGSLKNQQYAGRDPSDGVKKPLNAFLGELFLGTWNNGAAEDGETRLISEQVSHHPPVTACYLWNERVGIRAEGFTCQEITFSGSVNIKQKGYAILHVDAHDEDYLIPVPNVKVKGILGGTPYPELHGKYSIVSSRGFVAEVKFEGKGFFGSGTKNGVEAKVFHSDQPDQHIYTVEGSWSDSFEIKNTRSGKTIETYDVNGQPSLQLSVSNTSEQDPWESRKAWGGVREALRRGDMKGTTDAKSLVEQGQRGLRKDPEYRAEVWKRVFFHPTKNDEVFQKLSAFSKDGYDVDQSGGIWKVDKNAIENASKPYHGDLTPSGQRVDVSPKGNGTTQGAESETVAQKQNMKNSDPEQAIKEKSEQKLHQQAPPQTHPQTVKDAPSSSVSNPKEQEKPQEAQTSGYLDQAKHVAGQAASAVTTTLVSVASVIPGLSNETKSEGSSKDKHAELTPSEKEAESKVEKVQDPAQIEALLRSKYSTSSG